jgi:hypothetical protein
MRSILSKGWSTPYLIRNLLSGHYVQTQNLPYSEHNDYLDGLPYVAFPVWRRPIKKGPNKGIS